MASVSDVSSLVNTPPVDSTPAYSESTPNTSESNSASAEAAPKEPGVDADVDGVTCLGKRDRGADDANVDRDNHDRGSRGDPCDGDAEDNSPQKRPRLPDSDDGCGSGDDSGDNGIEDHSQQKRHRTPDVPFDLQDCIVHPEDITTTFQDVHLNQATFDALDSLTLPLVNPQGFTHGVLSRAHSQGVLLYGPPGTGKSHLVRALAKHTHAIMMTLSDADVNRCYVGETEQKIQEVFATARKNHPCIIFIDEADSLFSSRMNHEQTTRAHIHHLNQFLVEMDGIKSNRATSPMVIAATNRPYAMDEGILRRLGVRIMVDLPDVSARERILAIHLRGEPMAEDVDLAELARATPDYTGSDLNELVTAAARHAERDNIRGMGLRIDLNDGDGSLAGQLPKDAKVTQRLTSRVHFIRARDEVRAAPISETSGKIREFHNKYGSTGNTGYMSQQKAEIINKVKEGST